MERTTQIFLTVGKVKVEEEEEKGEEEGRWWETTTVYQIYPRSFQVLRLLWKLHIFRKLVFMKFSFLNRTLMGTALET